MKESELKRKIVARFRDEEVGGWGKRIEDQYAVGTPDLILAPPNCPIAFMAEAKILRTPKLIVTPRQYVDLKRVREAKNAGLQSLIVGLVEDTMMVYVSTDIKMEQLWKDLPHCPINELPNLMRRIAIDEFSNLTTFNHG